MRRHLKQKTDHSPGIRARVWFLAISVLSVCIFITNRPNTERDTGPIRSDEFADGTKAGHSWPESRRRRAFRVEQARDRAEYAGEEIDLSMVDQVVEDRSTWMDDAH